MVYITQEQKGKNLLPARSFGSFKVMLPEGMQIGFSGGQVAAKLKLELSEYNDDDYLLLIGDPIIIGIAVAVAGFWNNGKVKLLKWDRQEKVYYPVEIKLY